MKKILFCLSIFILPSLFLGCNDDDDNNEPSLKTGVITGQLKLFDEFGNAMPSNSNVTISTQTSEIGVSNASGIYQVTQLATGIYNLTYAKDGYGTYKKFNIQVNAGSNGTTLNGVDNIGALSTTIISNLTAFLNPLDSTYSFGCSLAPTPDASHPRAFRLFFAKTSDVNSQNQLFTPNNAWVSTTASGILTGFQRQNLYDNGFFVGDSVYVVAIGESMITNTYTDPVSHKKVYPNLNVASPSNVVGFVLE